jgi:hypothetical protein
MIFYDRPLSCCSTMPFALHFGFIEPTETLPHSRCNCHLFLCARVGH